MVPTLAMLMLVLVLILMLMLVLAMLVLMMKGESSSANRIAHAIVDVDGTLGDVGVNANVGVGDVIGDKGLGFLCESLCSC